MRKHVKKFFISPLILIILGCNTSNQKQVGQLHETKLETLTQVIQPTPNQELTLIVAGDALLHTAVYEDAKIIIPQHNETSTIKKETTYNFKPMFNLIAPIVQQYDLAFYNQETILGGKELGLSSYPAFNSPQEFGDCMIDIGFNLVSLANNHTLDRGEKAIIKSLKYWENKPVLHAGSYLSFDNRNTPKIYEKNGIKYTLLAYTYGTNGIPLPKGKEYLVNIYTKEMLANDIAQVRSSVDLLLVSMHWGNEYVFEPTKQQKDLAKFLAKQGVDIIIGTHPHVIQPIEWIDNTLVFYSLGNMISAQKGLERKIGLLGGISIIKNNDTNTINLQNLHVELIYTYHDSEKHNFRIYPFTQLNEEILPNYKKIYQEYLQILTKIDPQILNSTKNL